MPCLARSFYLLPGLILHFLPCWIHTSRIFLRAQNATFCNSIRIFAGLRPPSAPPPAHRQRMPTGRRLAPPAHVGHVLPFRHGRLPLGGTVYIFILSAHFHSPSSTSTLHHLSPNIPQILHYFLVLLVFLVLTSGASTTLCYTPSFIHSGTSHTHFTHPTLHNISTYLNFIPTILSPSFLDQTLIPSTIPSYESKSNTIHISLPIDTYLFSPSIHPKFIPRAT